jgi:lipoate-protein ligase A
MEWTGKFYDGVFRRLDASGFRLSEHDYTLGDLKFGGNAQSITKDKWLHHTSLLWDFDDALMKEYLTLPPKKKRPEYRRDRPHSEFLCRLKDALPSRSTRDVLDAVGDELRCHFDVAVCGTAELRQIEALQRFGDYRRSTKFLDHEDTVLFPVTDVQK